MSNQPDLRYKDKALPVLNIDSDSDLEQFMDIVLQDCPLCIFISHGEKEDEPISSKNVLYAYPLAFLMAFYVPLDLLLRDLLTLVKMQSTLSLYSQSMVCSLCIQ